MDKPELDWSLLGSKLFQMGKWEDALKAYDKGLEQKPNDKEMLMGRITVNEKLQRFGQCLIDSQNLLKLDGNNVHGVIGKGSSFIGLRKYSEALEYLKDFETTDDDVKNATERVRRLLRQSETGEGYDWEKLYCESKYEKPYKDVADYSKRVKVVKIQGKGRGLVVTEDVKAGDLVLVSKAVSFEVGKVFRFDLCNPGESLSPSDANFVQATIKNLKSKLLDRMNHDSDLLRDVFHLWAGPKLTFIDKEGRKGQQLVPDSKRLHRIIQYNMFSYGAKPYPFAGHHCPESHHIYPQVWAIMSAWKKRKNEIMCFNNAILAMLSHGLWLLPSYINHSCSGTNVTRVCSGDVMIIRALKDMKAGTEILWSYSDRGHFFDKRHAICESSGFVCSCEMCQYDKQTNTKIMKSFGIIHAMLFGSQPINNFSLKEVEMVFKEIKKISKYTPIHLNPTLGHVAYKLSELWARSAKRENVDIVDIANNVGTYLVTAFDYYYRTEDTDVAIDVALTAIISICNILPEVMKSRKNDNFFHFWVIRLRSAFQLLHGSLDFIDARIRIKIKSMTHLIHKDAMEDFESSLVEIIHRFL